MVILMEFFWSGWAIVPIVLYGIIGIVWFAHMRTLAFEHHAAVNRFRKRNRGYPGAIWAESAFNALILTIVALLIASSIVLVGSLIASNQDTKDATHHDVALEFGLASDTPYPMDIGTRSGTPGGSASAAAGFFRSSARVDLASGSTMPLSFVWQSTDGQEYVSMLEVPISQIDFLITDDGAPPEVVLQLSGATSEHAIWQRQGCRIVIVNLTIATRCDGEVELEVNSGVTLPQVVNAALIRATISLSQAQYDTLMGRV